MPTPQNRQTQPTNCLSVFDHLVGLGLKGLKNPLLVSSRLQMFYKISIPTYLQNSWENTSVRVSILSKFYLEAWNFIKKETSTHMLSCNLCENLRCYTVDPHSCFCYFPHTNLQEGELCQTKLTLLSPST